MAGWTRRRLATASKKGADAWEESATTLKRKLETLEGEDVEPTTCLLPTYSQTSNANGSPLRMLFGRGAEATSFEAGLI